MNSSKKNRHLLIQIGLITTALFAVAAFIIIQLIYVGTVDVFLKAKNDMLTANLRAVYNNEKENGETEWFFDYWIEHADEIVGYVDDGYRPADNVLEVYQNDTVDLEWLGSLSDKDKLFIARFYYSITALSFSLEQSMSSYDSLFCFDITDGRFGTVYFSNIPDTTYLLGDRLDIDLADHPALEKILNGSSYETVFEQVEDFPLEGSHYIGFLPILSDGKPKAVVGISYDWSEFNSGLRESLAAMAAAGIGGLVIIGGVLLLYLYFKAIRPLTKVKRGVLEYIGSKDSEQAVSRMSEIKSKNEVGVLADSFAQLAVEIDRYTAENLKLTGERERIAAELELAARIQTNMLPESFPEMEELELCAAMTPAKEVGGDFYDFIEIDSDHLGLVIADVSGKGVPAALFMMMSMSLIKSFVMRGDTPAEVLEHANDEICKRNNERMFVTVWLGILEISTGRITAANAGHEYPIIRQPDGSFELFKDTHSFVIGAKPGKKFKQYELTLGSGGTLFLYTDGVPEATDGLEEMFGTERLVDTLNSAGSTSPEKLLEEVKRAVDGFVGSADQFDDLTMLAVTRKGKPKQEQ